MNATKRFGLTIGSESNIFSHFLKDLQGDAFNIWTSGAYTLMQNEYPSHHMPINLINNIIINGAF